MKPQFAIVALSFALTSCAGMDAAMQYENVPMRTVSFRENDWRIFDDVARHKIMITPSIGRSAGAGVLAGLTFGAADTDIPKPEYQAVIEAWLLKKHGKDCVVTDGYKLIRPQWEFQYRC